MGKKEEQAQDQKPLIADRDTMTIYEMTVGDIIDGARMDIDRIEKQGKDRIAELEVELAAAKKELASASLRIGPAGMKRLSDGSLSLRIIVPVDAAEPLLSQADSAQENPEVFIQKAVEEGLLAYTMSGS